MTSEMTRELLIWYDGTTQWSFVCEGCHAELAATNPVWGAMPEAWHARALFELEQWVWADGRCQWCEVSYAVGGR